MNNKSLLEEYRHQFVVALAVTISIVTAIEIAAYILFVIKGLHTLKLDDSYLRYKVLLPLAVNMIAFVFVDLINNVTIVSQNFKNRAIVFGASVVAFVVSAVHREFIVNLGAFMFPMILSATFNDRKLLKQTSMLSVMALTTSVFLLYRDGAINITNFINIVVMYGFLAVSHLAGFVSIRLSQKSFRLIESQAEANSQLENIAQRDQMTGLFNHRAFYSKLDVLVGKEKPFCANFCLAMMDIDNFKAVNDSFGHDSGDVVLKNLAEIIEKHCAVDDIPFRYGGEEFAVIFYDKTPYLAEKTVKKILEEFSKSKYAFTDKSITFSCGMAMYKGDLTREELFNIADRRMYLAKENGKNQIRIA